MVWPLAAAWALYVLGVMICRRRRPWPWSRVALWTAGLVACAVAVAGPVAERSHTSFPAHMVTHLLLGMAGPLLLVLAAPVTLALRALPVNGARRLVRLLASTPVGVLVHPVTAGVLDLGGLWLLYTTELYASLHHSALTHLVVHVHVLVWGYLFTAALVSRDPDPHRRSYPVRSAALVLFLAGHAILAKYLYGHPPVGVPAEQAEQGALLMYYGGDLVEVAVLVILGARWYATSRPGRVLAEQAV